MAVPNTSNFTLGNVSTEVGYNNLNDCFTNSNANYFNVTYGTKTMSPKTLYGFRDYGSHNNSSCPAIGVSFGGGIVAYRLISGNYGYDSSKCQGYIMSNTNINTNSWGCSGTSVATSETTPTTMTQGQTNTNLILAACSGDIAARSCDIYSNDGYSDWHLPSNYELQYMASTAGVGIANICVVGGIMLSSSQANSTTCYAVERLSQGHQVITVPKGNGYAVRAIRYFSFNSGSTVPSLSTTSISNIQANGATSGGNTITDGGDPITSKGVCWSISSNPSISDSKTINGTGTGSFSSSITGLSVGTTYYVRAYATNGVGTSYGSNVSFTTLDPTITFYLSYAYTYNTYPDEQVEYTVTLSDAAPVDVTFTIEHYPSNGGTYGTFVTINQGSYYGSNTFDWSTSGGSYYVDSYIWTVPSGYVAGNDYINYNIPE